MNLADEDSFNDILDVICRAYRDPGVTHEALEDHIYLEDFVPLFEDVAEWVGSVVAGKTEQLPNAETPADA